MYYPHSFEEVCYTTEHIQSVLSEIKINFPNYFKTLIESDNGNTLDSETVKKLAEKFGNVSKPKKATVNVQKTLQLIVDESIANFKRDRKKYLDILNKDAISEFEDDPAHFKNTILRNQCPIIHHTLQNRLAKELDRYRVEFKIADPGDLLRVVKNITEFARNYYENYYDSKKFEKIDSPTDLNFSELQEEDYIVYGVIGGGIKSHFLYKLYPDIFPNRSREAIWALWYLTSKKTFDCVEDSEFLMINTKLNITQQNYFYPYDLFGFYALEIYKMLKTEALKNAVKIKSEFRFILVDAFLSYISKSHIDEIDFLKKKVTEDSYGY
jgi:hypothetical protein